MTCGRCAREIEIDSVYCRHCGARVAATAGPARRSLVSLGSISAELSPIGLRPQPQSALFHRATAFSSE